MAHKGKPPSAGVRVGLWRFDKTPAGTERDGWLAGPVHGLQCHPSRATKPCYKCLISRDAECEGCERTMRVEYFGYVPVRRADGKPLVIGIHESVFWIVDKIELGKRITWGRQEGAGEGVWVAEGPAKPTWWSYYPDERPEHNITDYLALKLWKRPDILPALYALWGTTNATATNETVPPAPTPAPRAARASANPAVDALADKIASVTLDDTLASLRRKQARLAAGPEHNGVHAE